MNEFLTLIIFTIPGLLAYFWIQLFGLTPTSKRESTEVIAISALLWIPIVISVLIIYQLLALTSHWSILHPSIDIPILKKNWFLISNEINDLTKLSKKNWFILYYVTSSILISFYISKFITGKGYKFLLDKINKVREENGIAPLSEQTTVWNTMFLQNVGQIVEVSKIDSQEKSLVGCLTKVPRANEPSKDIVLEATDHWAKIMEYFDVRIEHVFIDTTSGTIIKIYDSNEALQAQDLYNQGVSEGTISSVLVQ